MKAIKRPDGYRSRRYIFKNYDSVVDLEHIARGSGWEKILDRQADPARGTDRLVKWELASGLRVAYTEDSSLACSYVIATSSLGAQEVETAVAVFEAHPKVVREAELLAAADSADTPPDTALAIARAGLGAPLEPEERFVERIQDSVHSTEAIVREGALWAIAHTEWKLFEETLREISENDQEEALRAMAGQIIDIFRSLGLE